MRTVLLLALIAIVPACNEANGSKLDDKSAPATAPRNFVCERVAEVNKDAKCVAELSGDGELVTHRARVTTKDGTVSCSINDRMSFVSCGVMFEPPQQPQDEKAAAEKPAPAPKSAPKAPSKR